MATATDDVDVLIIGAGPAGSVLTCLPRLFSKLESEEVANPWGLATA